MQMPKVSQDTLIGEVLRIDKDTAPLLMSYGMHCLGCPASQGESIADACAAHGLDPEELVSTINDFLEKKS
jgi:hybrid cluster-associated redox disulfide protein